MIQKYSTLTNQIQQHIKRIIHQDQTEWVPGIVRMVQQMKILNKKKKKDKNHRIISSDTIKALHKNSTPFHDKNTQQTTNRKKKNFLEIIKSS